MNIGTWSGWTEPAHEHDPMDDTTACPMCGFSPRRAIARHDKLRFIILSCCQYETTPRLTLAVAVREWNDAVDAGVAGQAAG